MSLLVDRRKEIDGPGTHALVVGVSAYPHLEGGTGALSEHPFGMGQLWSAALTAATVADHVAQHTRFAAPLATCRLLASPSQRERDVHRGLVDAQPATLTAFLSAAADWRRDAAAHRDSIALLYVVGHGLEHGHADQVFVLQDFGDGIGPLFRNAITMASIAHGMAPSDTQPQIARRQVFAFDASRVPLPDEYTTRADNATRVFDATLPTVDDRQALTMYASARGQPAFATRSGTPFSQALLRCLDGAAATPLDEGDAVRWGVTMSALVRGMQREAGDLSERLGAPVTVDFGGSIGDALLVELQGPPLVAITIDLGTGSVPETRNALLTNADDEVVWSSAPPAAGQPLVATVPAGLYRLSLEPPPGQPGPIERQRWRIATPPEVRWSAGRDRA